VSPLLERHHNALSQGQLPSFQIVKEQPIALAREGSLINAALRGADS